MPAPAIAAVATAVFRSPAMLRLLGFLRSSRLGKTVAAFFAGAFIYLLKVTIFALVSLLLVYYGIQSRYFLDAISGGVSFVFSTIAWLLDNLTEDVVFPTRPSLFTRQVLQMADVLRIFDIAVTALYFLGIRIVIGMFLIMVSFFKP